MHKARRHPGGPTGAPPPCGQGSNLMHLTHCYRPSYRARPGLRKCLPSDVFLFPSLHLLPCAFLLHVCFSRARPGSLTRALGGRPDHFPGLLMLQSCSLKAQSMNSVFRILLPVPPPAGSAFLHPLQKPHLPPRAMLLSASQQESSHSCHHSL